MLLCLTVAQVSGQDKFIIRHFQENLGLSSNFVTSTLQSADGRLLVATKGGLNYFDGRQFNEVSLSDEVIDNASALWAHRDVMLIGLSDGNILLAHKGNLKLLETPLEDQIVFIEGSSLDNLTAISRSGVILSVQNGAIRSLPLSESGVLVNSVERWSKDQLLVATNEGLLLAKVNAQGLEAVIPVNGFPETRTLSLAIDSINRVLWVGTEDLGLFELRGDRNGGFKVASYKSGNGNSVDEVRSMKIDSRGRLWMGVGNGGVFMIQPGVSGELKNSSVSDISNAVLDQHQIHHIHEDSEGSIWFSTFGGGVVQVMDKVFDNPFDEDWLRQQRITRLYRDRANNIWLGIDKGIFSTRAELKNAPFNYHHIGGHTVSSIFQSDNGNLWVGTASNGLFTKSNRAGNFQNINLPGGNLSNSINAITQSGDMLHICTKNGLFIMSESGGLKKHLTTVDGLPHNNVLFTLTDRHGNIWIANQGNRVAFLSGDEIRFLEEGSSQNITDVHHISEDHSGRLWFATLGSGVFVLDEGMAYHIGEDEGMPSSYCYEMVLDRDGNMWVSHQKSISRIDGDLKVTRVIGHQSLSPVANTMVTSLFKDQEDNIWVTSTHGVVRYNPRIDRLGQTMPNVSITALRVGDKSMEMNDNMRLPYARYNLSFDISGVSLRNPESIRYKYRLSGYSNEWSEEFTTDVIQFPRLEDGDYVLEVAARKDGSDWSVPAASHAFSIAKPFYRTWPFFVLSIVCAAALVGGFIRYRTVKLSADKLALEKVVAERTEQIQQQKVEIEQSRDEIARYAKDITDSIKYAQRIQSAIFPEWDRTSSVIPDSFVFFRSKDIVSGDFFFAEKVGDLVIFATVDCTGHGVPGGFMSIVANNLLVQAVRQIGLTKPSDILDFMNEGITNTLHQTYEESSVKDGLDIALCALNIKAKLLQFAGAYNPLYIFRDGELQMYRGDRFPVGAFVGEEIRSFANLELQLKSGDMIYIFSDGYSDQFGGPRGKKLKLIGFREILEQIHRMPVEQQEVELAQRLKDWMGKNEQVDDIVVMGVHIT